MRYARTFALSVVFVLIAAACSDKTTTTTSTTTTTTTVAPTTTTSTTTTTLPPTTTTTVAMIPPSSGFYVVSESVYWSGLALTAAETGNPNGSGTRVGYLLDVGGEVLAPFGGEISSAIATMSGRLIIFLTAPDGAVMAITGDPDSLFFPEEGELIDEGDVVVTVSGGPLAGVSKQVNVLIEFLRLDSEAFAYQMDWDMMSHHFTFLFPDE